MILLGLSRSGKTSVGRLLAKRLGCSFYDTDELIRIRTGLTPRELCRQGGVSALHAAEAAALRECCVLHDCGGDAFAAEPLLSSVSLSLPTDGSAEKPQEASAIVAAIPLRVFLYATEAALFERLTHDALQTGYYPAFLRFLPVAQKAEARHLFIELYTRRTELYRRSCNLIIDTAGLDCAAAAQKIAEQSSHFPRT